MATIGIDLGTSNSAAAVLRGGRPVLIPSAEGVSLGGKAFPSYVALTADGTMLIGEPARLKASVGPDASLDDVFLRYSGSALQEGGSYRDVRAARSTEQRLG